MENDIKDLKEGQVQIEYRLNEIDSKVEINTSDNFEIKSNVAKLLRSENSRKFWSGIKRYIAILIIIIVFCIILYKI